MRDLFVVKVQTIPRGGAGGDRVLTKMFMAHDVVRHDPHGGDPFLNFWVRDKNGGSVLHQANLNGCPEITTRDQTPSTDYYIHAIAAFVDTTCGSRVETLRPNSDVRTPAGRSENSPTK